MSVVMSDYTFVIFRCESHFEIQIHTDVHSVCGEKIMPFK